MLRVVGDSRLQRRLARRPLIRSAQSMVRRPRVGCCQLAFCGNLHLLTEVGPACSVLDATGHVASECRAAAVVYGIFVLRALSEEAAGLGLDVLHERCWYSVPELEEAVVVARLSELASKAGGV